MPEFGEAGWGIAVSMKRQFAAEIPAFPPSEVELERFPLERDKGQPQPLIFADRPIPAATRIEHLVRALAGAAEGLVGQPNHIESQIVGGIAEIPPLDPMRVGGAIVIWRNRVILIAQPEFWTPFKAMGDVHCVGNGYMVYPGGFRARCQGEPCKSRKSQHCQTNCAWLHMHAHPGLGLIGSVLDQPTKILTQSALREFNPRRFLERLGLLSPAVRAVLVQLDVVIHGDGVSSFNYKSPDQRGKKHFY